MVIKMFMVHMRAAPPNSIPPIGSFSTAQSRKQVNGIDRYISISTELTVLYCILFVIVDCYKKDSDAKPKAATYNSQL